MPFQADTMDALHQEAEHLKALLEKCAELSAAATGDLASIPVTPGGCISTAAIQKHWDRMRSGESNIAELVSDIAILGGKIGEAKAMALDTSARLDARKRAIAE